MKNHNIKDLAEKKKQKKKTTRTPDKCIYMTFWIIAATRIENRCKRKNGKKKNK